MSDRPFTNIGDDDWSKPIELHEQDHGVHQVVLIGFDGKDLAVVRKVNYAQYIAYRKEDGSLSGGSSWRYIRNKMGV
jgi:hypothetical protein